MNSTIKSRVCIVILVAAAAAATGVEPGTATAPAPSTTQSAASAPASQDSARRVHVFVSGRVQGVNYRAFTMESAQRLHLTGWVKNLYDGRVEAVIEGKSGNIDKLLEAMKKGPPAAGVKSLDVKEETPDGEFSKFEIQR